ncbi:MAG: serine/threonine-protein kinase [bacterium]|nr:serine/threonine-protein kinase [bacterium]
MTNNFTGYTVNGYELREQVARSAATSLYRGYSSELKRDVAIKRFLVRDEDHAAHLLENGQRWKNIRHRCVLTVHDVWVEPNEGVYLVMPWMSGGSLRDQLHGKPLKPDRVSELMVSLSAALMTTHHLGLLHRSIKPENILFDAIGTPYLSDFALDHTTSPQPELLTPEQSAGQPLTPQSDLFLLGLLLVEALTGVSSRELRPYNTVTVEHAAIKDALLASPLVTYRRAAVDDLFWVFSCVLDSRPNKRYRDSLELAKYFLRALTGKEPSADVLDQILDMTYDTQESLDAPTQVALTGNSTGEAHSLTGRHLGSYEVRQVIGRGGMGEVYLGYHPLLERTVAIKIMRPEFVDEAELRKRFEREARTVAKLRHANIVTMYDFGQLENLYYMVMEYIDGYTLAEALHHVRQYTPSEALPIITEVASALDYAHSHGIVHRDVKPSNVMLQRLGDTINDAQRAILMDFGITKVIGLNEHLTDTDRPVGTYDYMAPEQVLGERSLDRRADIYALGIMVYQMLTGQLPFRAKTTARLVFAHLKQTPAYPGSLAPDLPDSISDAIMRAIAKDPADRFPTAGEFAAALTE